MIQKLIQRSFGKLTTTINPMKNAYRFENQNLTYTFEEINQHSDALAYGLIERGTKQGDQVLMLLGKSNTAELIVSMIGCAKAGAVFKTVNLNDANVQDNLNAALKSTSVLIYSPNTKVNQKQKLSELINSTLPETQLLQKGESFSSKNFQSLKWLIHTGFYSQKGALKFKENLVYASKNFNRLKLPELKPEQQILLDSGKTWNLSQLSGLKDELRKELQINEQPLLIGNLEVNSRCFALSVLNTLLHGNLCVLVGDKKAEEISHFYEHNITI